MTSLLDRWQVSAAPVDEQTVGLVASEMVGTPYQVVEVVPPRDTSTLDATLPRFVRTIMELQTRLAGLVNASPVSWFELRRNEAGQVRLQFAVPTQRLERKLRLQLETAVPGIGFRTGVSRLPVSTGDVVGGGLLTTGRPDMFPLRTEFDTPPTDNIIAALHQDAFPGERVIVQLLFQPVAGRPLRNWWWRHRAFKRVGWLRKEKHAVVPWQNRPATKIERQQADAVEQKARNPQFRVSIRLLFMGVPRDLVKSRVKEIGGAFNVYESEVTNQYLDTYTVSAWNPDGIRDFVTAVAYRRSDEYVLPFRAGIPELAGLLAVPSNEQANLRRADP